VAIRDNMAILLNGNKDDPLERAARNMVSVEYS
jgi:hypothetical protein